MGFIATLGKMELMLKESGCAGIGGSFDAIYPFRPAQH